MKNYTTQIDYQGMPKGTILKPVPNYAAPVPYATEAELAKKNPTNFFFLSFIISHPEIFREVTEAKKSA